MRRGFLWRRDFQRNRPTSNVYINAFVSAAPPEAGQSKISTVRWPTHRGTSLTRKCTSLGPNHRPMPRVLGESYGVGVFLLARYPCSALKDLRVTSTDPPKRDPHDGAWTSKFPTTGCLAHEKHPPLPRSCSRTRPRVLWWSLGGGRFLMSEVPLYIGGPQSRGVAQWSTTLSSKVNPN